jgi:Zinc knuckle
LLTTAVTTTAVPHTGQDLDPTNEEAGEEASRRKGASGGLQAPLELGAVFNTQCSKCGAKGHMSVDCFSRVSGAVAALCYRTIVIVVVVMRYIALLSSAVIMVHTAASRVIVISTSSSGCSLCACKRCKQAFSGATRVVIANANDAVVVHCTIRRTIVSATSLQHQKSHAIRLHLT